MANGKKSFILYCDLLHTLKHLDNEQSGKLFKHILSYVNDENPVTDDPFIKIAFEPIKQSLKRDLRKYEQRSDSRSNAGKLGNLKRYYLDIYEKVDAGRITLDEGLKLAETRKASQGEKKLASVADNDSDNDNDSVNVSDSVSTDVDVYTDIEILKEKYLSDPKICSAVIDNKKNKIENRSALEISLDQFNDHLKQTGQNVKPWNDYTKHFLNWQRKDKTEKGSFDAAEYIRNGISST